MQLRAPLFIPFFAIANRLTEVSSKAEENGERYARLTAENATAAVDRQRCRQRPEN
jgi:hypothetical protein